MRLIRFVLEGNVNSIRYEHSRKNHRTYLIPPKTTILGLLANICGVSLPTMPQLWDISVGVVPKKIDSLFEDTWVYKLLEHKKNDGSQRGGNTGVVFRERLYMPVYAVYLKVEDDVFAKKIASALKEPQRSSALGQSDEMILIRQVEDITKKAEIKKMQEVNSSFFGMQIQKYVIDGNGFIVPPRKVQTPCSFSFSGAKRSQEKIVDMIDFYGVKVGLQTSFEGISFENDNVFLY